MKVVGEEALSVLVNKINDLSFVQFDKILREFIALQRSNLNVDAMEEQPYGYVLLILSMNLIQYDGGFDFEEIADAYEKQILEPNEIFPAMSNEQVYSKMPFYFLIKLFGFK